MNFFILYQKNQIEETNKAKNMFVGLKVTMDGVERKNYYAPLSWIIGCLRYAISPVVALVRTGIDFYTRNISPEHLKETLNILEEALIQPNEFDCF